MFSIGNFDFGYLDYLGLDFPSDFRYLAYLDFLSGGIWGIWDFGLDPRTGVLKTA